MIGEFESEPVCDGSSKTYGETDMTDTDLTPVTDAYRQAHKDGQTDHDAFNAALTVYQKLLPDVPIDEARNDVARLIAGASEAPDFWEL